MSVKKAYKGAHKAEVHPSAGNNKKLCAKIACKENQRMHARIVGLKFLDVAVNLRGEYVFTYGED